MNEKKEVQVDDYDYPVAPTWCPGCGNFSILGALKQALSNLSIPPHNTLMVSGIGCGSKLVHYINGNGLHTVHGRPLPVATGAQLANPSLNVIVTSGDGDSYGIGGNHFLHTCRRNIDITHILEDTRIYGLPKVHYSPTSDEGFVTKTTPGGAIEKPVNPIAQAIASNATFIARGFAGDVGHLADLYAEAIKHKGYSLINTLQPCVTFNRVNTYESYHERVYKLEEEDYDPSDKEKAIKKAGEWEEKIPLGIIYREERPTYSDQLKTLKKGPVVDQELDRNKRKDIDLEKLKQEFT